MIWIVTFLLSMSAFTGEVSTSPGDFLLLAGPTWIAGMDLTSQKIISNFSVNGSDIYDVDYDPVTERVYWNQYSDSTINSAFLDGSNNATVLDRSAIGNGSPYTIALDPVSRLLFYSIYNRAIFRSKLEGDTSWDTSIAEVVNHVVSADIAIDEVHKQLYWTDMGNLWRADYSGAGKTMVVNIGQLGYSAVTVDAEKGVLFFYNDDKKSIEAIHTDGTNRHVIVSHVDESTPAMDYSDGNLYFINHTAGDDHGYHLMVVPVDGGAATKLGPALGQSVLGIHVCPRRHTIHVLEGIRLVNGSSPKYGRLEVQVKGQDQWMGVCADFIDTNTANVICNTLGYNRYGLSTDAIRVLNHNGPDANLLVLQTSNCTGNESRLADCDIPVTYNGSCQSNRDVIIDCAPALEDIVKLQCTPTTWLVTVDMDTLSYRFPGSRASDIYLGDNSCTGVLHGNDLVFLKDFTDCLTTQTEFEGGVKYVNQLIDATHNSAHPYEVQTFKWSLELGCTDLNNSAYGMLLTFNHSVSTPHIPAVTKGFHLDVKFYTDSNYMQPLAGDSLAVPDGTTVYAKAFVSNADWSIKMKLNTCYMSSTDGDVIKTYFLIKHGCEVDTNTHFISETMHETKFMFQLFEEKRNNKVVVHCYPVYCDTARSDSLLQCENQCDAH